MTCPSCGSEHTALFQTDRYQRLTCKACGKVSEERWNAGKRKAKTEAEEAAQEISG